MRSFGSQGQQRTCALALKLAELNLIKEETEEDAILLLDDVMSELDIERQKYLIKTLKENQLFITTTDIDKNLMTSFPDAKLIYIHNGKITEN
jgi:DNA replication and repair protein RecF